MLALLLWVKQAVVSAVLAWAGVDYQPAHTAPAPPHPPAAMIAVPAPPAPPAPGEAACTVETRRMVVIDVDGRRTVITSSSSPSCGARPMFDTSCGDI